jgi:adenylosuccinate lyase
MIAADPDISSTLKREEIDSAFELGTYLRNVDTVFSRVFGTTR